MERADENLEGLWRTARTLWIKYCGISDEYKMLRDRWLYLHGENKLMVLPYLKRKTEKEEKKTFDLLNDHSKDLEEMFGEIGFTRSKMENLSNFTDNVGVLEEVIDRVKLINRLRLIEEYFYDLSNFVGLLKSAFFQRTVSAEIQHVVSGLPHSPERTIGNELFYLAADNVARRYCECLNIPYGRWDGFITFIPPIEEGLFYGAFYNPSPYLKLFHVSMSEEAKYFVGSYLVLAHEFGHSIMSVKPDLFKKDVYPKWFKTITKEICNRTHRILEINKRDCCEFCPIYKNLYAEDYEERYLLFKRNYKKVFCLELLADIIAYWIAGKNYVQGFIDAFFHRVSIPNIELLLRVVSTFEYLKIVDKNIANLKITINKFVEVYEYYNSEVLNEIYGDEEGIKEEDYKCPVFQECVSRICDDWARTINKFDKYDTDYLSEEPEEYTIPQHLEVNDSFFKTIIKDEFRIGEEENTKIIAALKEGRPIPEEDPRHIMHCYYEAYKQSDGENRPNYAATIYSLAFNTNSKNRRD
jgi:hypothetical protein